LFFENYGQKVGGTNTLLVPKPKVGGPVSPGPHGCCAYGITPSELFMRLFIKSARLRKFPCSKGPHGQKPILIRAYTAVGVSEWAGFNSIPVGDRVFPVNQCTALVPTT